MDKANFQGNPHPPLSRKWEREITLAMTGASGFQYGMRLLECLLKANVYVNLLVSQAAIAVAALEANIQLPGQTTKLASMLQKQFQISSEQLRVFASYEWTASVASGSNTANAMVVCPCSSGCLASIASGMSENLIERAADVMIKEKKPLILVLRETPLSAIHLENMLKLARMNVVILPAAPGFYHQPTSIEDLIDFIVARVLDHLQIEHQLLPRWGSS